MIIPLDFTSKALIKKRGVLIALLHLYFILPVQLAKREGKKSFERLPPGRRPQYNIFFPSSSPTFFWICVTESIRSDLGQSEDVRGARRRSSKTPSVCVYVCASVCMSVFLCRGFVFLHSCQIDTAKNQKQTLAK